MNQNYISQHNVPLSHTDILAFSSKLSVCPSYPRNRCWLFALQHHKGNHRDFPDDPMPISVPAPRVLVNVLDTLLKQCHNNPACRWHVPRRGYASISTLPHKPHEVKDIAVLGGGITGLASAYFLSRNLPNAKITLFEASSRLGGWLHSKSVEVGTGKVVFEQGPRNLRPTNPNGLITLDLVCPRV